MDVHVEKIGLHTELSTKVEVPTKFVDVEPVLTRDDEGVLDDNS